MFFCEKCNNSKDFLEYTEKVEDKIYKIENRVKTLIRDTKTTNYKVKCSRCGNEILIKDIDN